MLVAARISFQVNPKISQMDVDGPRQVVRRRIQEAGLLQTALANNVREHGHGGRFVLAERHALQLSVGVAVLAVPFTDLARDVLARLAVNFGVLGLVEVSHGRRRNRGVSLTGVEGPRYWIRVPIGSSA